MSETGKAWPFRYDHPVPWGTAFRPRLLHDLLSEQAGKTPGAPFLDFMGRRFTYGDIAEKVAIAAAGFRRMGVSKGCRVGLFLPNCPQYVIAYYAVLMAGGTVVNFSPLYSEDELIFQVQDSGTEIMVTLDLEQLYPLIAAVQAKTELKTLVVGNLPEVLPWVKGLAYRALRGGDRAAVDYGPTVRRFSDLLDGPPLAEAEPLGAESDTALIQYTGGTTGRPKGAVLTHANLSVNAAQVNSIDPGTPGNNSILGALPFFHVFANTCVLNRTVIAGGWIVMMPKFELTEALALIERHRIASLPGVPTMYQAFLDHPNIAKHDLTSLEICISGGAPMAKELRDAFIEKTGAKLVEGYGLTESAGVVSCNPYESGGKPGSIGQPLPGTSIVIVDKEDPETVLPQGERGEITIAGPQILTRYHNRPEANETTFVEGRLRTGDVGYLDADGYAYIVDRLKDLILVGGFNIYPSALEAVLYRHEAVKEALVIGIPDDRLGERPKAFVTLKEGAAANVEELLAFLNAHVGKHERAAALEIRDALPKTMIGKLSRKELEEEEAAKRAATELM